MKSNIIFDFIKKNKISYIVGMGFIFLAAYVQTSFPKILGNTIDMMKADNFDKKLIITNIFYILLIAAATFVCTFSWRNLVIGNARKLECVLREKLFKHFLTLSPEFYSKRKTGDLIAYAINDISAVRQTFGGATAMSLNSLFVCVASIYFMFMSVDFKLTLIILSPFPILVYIMLKVGKNIQVRFKKVQEIFASISDRVQENIYGIKVIKSYVQEEDEIGKFEALSVEMMDASVDMVRVSSYLSPVIEICFSISFVLNLIIGGNMVLKDQITLGDFVAFNSYLAMILGPIVSIGRVITMFQRGMASLQRLNEIFDTKPDIKESESPIKQALQGDIEFKNLSFYYPGSQTAALKNISLKIPKGHTIGIIGRTGSGKSTMASLLFRLYNINSEELFLDGRDINDYSVGYVRNSFGFVPQETFLFSATIRDNIVFYKDIYDDEDVEEASKYSQIYNSIVNFPDGFDTMLGERGVNLSGGQKQRVAIARAIIKKPTVLILDDSLSAVDTITEEQILKNLKKYRQGKTTIIISHRVSAMADADEIIVLDQGEIREKGSKDELLKKGGLFCDIYTQQAKDEASKIKAD